MHILLTDILTCPRCGPEFGLILQADDLADRRVGGGWLGCANCRELFEIREGVVDLRSPAAGEARMTPLDGDAERAFRCAALLGASASLAPVGVVEASGRVAPEVARHLGATHVVSAMAEPPSGALPGGVEGVVSPILVGARLPLRSRSLRGIALLGGVDPALLVEAARTVAPGGRVVLDPAPPGAAERLREAGLEVLLEQEGVVVASPPSPR